MSNGNIKFLGTIIILLVAMFGYEKYEAISKENQYLKQISEGSQKLRDFNSKGDLQPADLSKKTDNTKEEKQAEPQINASKNRDSNLIGRWYEQTSYKSGGINTETYLSFFEDGTMAQTTQSHGTLQGYDSETTIINDKVTDPELQAAMNEGYRWVTQNGKICTINPDGSINNCNRTYSFENQYLFIQLDGYKKPHAYTRAN